MKWTKYRITNGKRKGTVRGDSKICNNTYSTDVVAVKQALHYDPIRTRDAGKWRFMTVCSVSNAGPALYLPIMWASLRSTEAQKQTLMKEKGSIQFVLLSLPACLP